MKKIAFSLIAAALALIGLTLAFSFLEKEKFIRTETPDDRAVYFSAQTSFSEIKGDNGSTIRIVDPSMLKVEFPMRKPPSAFRLFVAGESFALGSPYVVQTSVDTAGGIGDFIRAELTLRFPSRQIEIINVAAGGQNSFRVAAVVREILRFEPDAVFVATGNNEGFIPRSEFNLKLHQWVLYRAWKRSLLSFLKRPERSYYTLQSAEARQVLEAYRKNILSILGAAKRRNVPVLLATMPVNLKWPYEHGRIPGLDSGKQDAALSAGLRLQSEGRYAQAVDEFKKSSFQVPAVKLMGECFEALGDFDKAKNFYSTYVEISRQNRTPPSFNAFLREAAEREGAFLVDLEALAEKNSPNGIPGRNLFYDFCHMYWEGYYLCAQEVLRVMLKEDLIKGAKGEPLEKPSLDRLLAMERFDKLLSGPYQKEREEQLFPPP